MGLHLTFTPYFILDYRLPDVPRRFGFAVTLGLALVPDVPMLKMLFCGVPKFGVGRPPAVGVPNPVGWLDPGVGVPNPGAGFVPPGVPKLVFASEKDNKLYIYH